MTAGKILILEDDPDVARFYEAALREDGNSVTVCGTFEEAREHLRHEQPDAVVTGYDDAVLRRDVGEMQGEFLVKPVRVTQLKNAVYA